MKNQKKQKELKEDAKIISMQMEHDRRCIQEEHRRQNYKNAALKDTLINQIANRNNMAVADRDENRGFKNDFTIGKGDHPLVNYDLSKELELKNSRLNYEKQFENNQDAMLMDRLNEFDRKKTTADVNRKNKTRVELNKTLNEQCAINEEKRNRHKNEVLARARGENRR